MKRGLSVFLALTLVISLISVTASASVTAVKVSISSSAKTITVNNTLNLSVKLTPADKYNNVVWDSNDTAIATVDSSGRVTAVAPGEVTISAEIYNGLIKLGTGSIKLRVVKEAVEPSRVNIYASSDTVRVNRTLQLDYKIYPNDKTVNINSIEWYSYDEEIAEVDEYGEVTGIAPGETTIMVRIFGKDSNRRTIRLDSGSINITVVPGSAASGDDSMPKPSAQASSKTSNTGYNLFGGKISTADITSAVKKAVVKGKTTSVRFKDASSVSAASLQAAATSMKNGGGVVLLNFDTMENAETADVRLSINPADAAGIKGDIKLGAYTNEDKVGELKKNLQEKFKNKMVVVKCDQSDSYGMPVNFSVRMGSTTIREKNIKVYTYNRSTGKYSELENANIWLDVNKFVHFTAATGGYFIISGGSLTRR